LRSRSLEPGGLPPPRRVACRRGARRSQRAQFPWPLLAPRRHGASGAGPVQWSGRRGSGRFEVSFAS